jgi:death-on-curing protein
MGVEFLTVDDVLRLHAVQVARYGGAQGIRDQGGLESAVAQPQAGFGGEYLHRDLFEMAAAYFYHLNKNHPFLDGNKRVGVHAALVFLAMNGMKVTAPGEDLYQLSMRVARGEASKPEISEFLRHHSEAV